MIKLNKTPTIGGNMKDLLNRQPTAPQPLKDGNVRLVAGGYGPTRNPNPTIKKR